MLALLINRRSCSTKSVAEYLKRPSSAPSELSEQSKEENRKLLSETFDIQSDEGQGSKRVLTKARDREVKERSGSCISEDCDYDSDGDHQHIIEHIQRNRCAHAFFATTSPNLISRFITLRVHYRSFFLHYIFTKAMLIIY